MLGSFGRIVRTIGFVVSLAASATANGEAAPSAGGATISNTVTASYTSSLGVSYTTQSNTVVDTVALVSAISVSPKETAPSTGLESYSLNAPVTRTFTITNASNISDAYTITSVALSAGKVTSIAFIGPNGPIPVTQNATVSPTVPAGGFVQVIVTIDTTGIPVGTTISVALHARTTVSGTSNGLQTDAGQQYAVTQGAPVIGGSTGANTKISKLVDNLITQQSAPGSTVTYQISFMNYGQSAATNGFVLDAVPAGIHADPASAMLNGVAITGATLTGQNLRIPVGTVVPNVPMAVSFTATVDTVSTSGQSFVNIASFGADGMAPISTTPASVFIGSADIVYDGLGGEKNPITGATVSLVDPKTLLPIALPAVSASTGSSSSRSKRATGSQVNPSNANPMVTGVSGLYAFEIPVPAVGATTTFDIIIATPNYLPRKINVVLTPDPTDDLYTVSLNSLDGQPLAQAGGFALTTTNVQIANVFGLLGNLPLFSTHPITVTKTADKQQVSGGDRVLYTVTYTSTAQAPLGATTVVDTLPAGILYAPGTSTVDGVRTEPQQTGQTLTWNMSALSPAVTHTITYACVVSPSAPPHTMLVNVVSVSAAIPTTTLQNSGQASYGIFVANGIFTQSGAITGRVFVDAMHTGHFREGDKGVPGIKIYLESGESVSTDPFGRFSFVSVNPGLHVLHIDETTMPRTVHTYATRAYDSERSPIRLIHGLFDMGLLQDVNFALDGTL